ncbi:MAG: hypothetical protein R3229_03990 [Alphaproteobacteria bacterium]|nr:hypothetical protein [Alphaproteobacteria bacterium]
MRKRRLKAVLTFVAMTSGLMLGACETNPPPSEFPELTYRHLGPLTLDVARIEISTRYIPPLKPPNVEHRAPVPPYVAIRKWGNQRLKAVGSRHVARLVILDASIREVPLPVSGGIKGLFTSEQSARYDARAAVLLEIRDFGGRQLAFVTARATRSLTVAEGAAIADREKVWFALTEDLVADLNRRLEVQAQRHFSDYLVAG